MTPHTLHLIASMVRHGRGIVTSIEKWIRAQEPSPACREGLQIVSVSRAVLSNLEAQLVSFDVDVSGTVDRAEVEQPTGSEAGRLSSPLTRVK